MPLDKKKNIRLSPHLLFEYNKVYLTEVFFKCDLLALWTTFRFLSLKLLEKQMRKKKKPFTSRFAFVQHTFLVTGLFAASHQGGMLTSRKCRQRDWTGSWCSHMGKWPVEDEAAADTKRSGGLQRRRWVTAQTCSREKLGLLVDKGNQLWLRVFNLPLTAHLMSWRSDVAF